MKKFIKIIISVFMAVLTAAVLPAQVLADSATEYISEVKIGMGKKASEAESALAGYTRV